MKITELINKKTALTAELANASRLVDECYISLHERLIKAGFYDTYIYDNSPLSGMFWIVPYRLPYSDQGEGDYHAIDLILNGTDLEVEYQVSYNNNRNCTLLTIPLNIIEGDYNYFKEWLDITINEKMDAYKKQITVQNEAKRKQDIANLKLQLKNLGA